MLMAPRYWRYVLYRAYANLLSEASRFRLGWLWWIAEPLAMTAVFYVVFRYLRGAEEDFVYFLIVGVVAWLWFSSGAGNATQSLANARSLVLQVKLPKMIFPLIGVVSVTFKQAFVFGALLAAVGGLAGAGAAWLALPVLFATQLLFIAAVACSFAFLCAWLPDLRFLVASGLQLMMFCSGASRQAANAPKRRPHQDAAATLRVRRPPILAVAAWLREEASGESKTNNEINSWIDAWNASVAIALKAHSRFGRRFLCVSFDRLFGSRRRGTYADLLRLLGLPPTFTAAAKACLDKGTAQVRAAPGASASACALVEHRANLRRYSKLLHRAV